MAWFWTDDLARILVATGVSESSVQDWISTPVAVAAADGTEALDVALDLAGLGEETQVA